MLTEEFLFGDTGVGYLLVIAVRTFIMFLSILIFLRLLGKRGVKQLSVFELVVILGLGSAAGDPMIYKEIGVITAIVAFIVVVVCYKLLTILVFKYKPIEHLIEGKEVYIVREGVFAIDEFSKETLSKDEFFMELRQNGVYHLGQVEYAVLEVSGEVSVFFYEKEATRFGLPILPDSLKKQVATFKIGIHYACSFCGYTFENKKLGAVAICSRCSSKDWIIASNRPIVL